MGTLDPTFTGMVTVQLTANPGSANLGGTLTVPAKPRHGDVHRPDTGPPRNGFVLQATSNGLTSGSTPAFDVSGITNLSLSNAERTRVPATRHAGRHLSSTETGTSHSFTYTLVSGAGASDNVFFSIKGNQFLTADSFDAPPMRVTRSAFAALTRSAATSSRSSPSPSCKTRPEVRPALPWRCPAPRATTPSLRPRPRTRSITLDGVSLAVDVSTVSTITFQASTGSSTATLTGGSGANTATLSPNTGTLVNSAFTVIVTDVTTIVVIGGPGDTANLYDSSSVVNTFTSTMTESYLSGTGYFNEVVGIGTVVAYGIRETTRRPTCTMCPAATRSRPRRRRGT